MKTKGAYTPLRSWDEKGRKFIRNYIRKVTTDFIKRQKEVVSSKPIRNGLGNKEIEAEALAQTTKWLMSGK